ncbi:hypothetical protein IV203_002382 [Nitzschia inconspicua]|uniref:Uncharacterized protein n=1 Tax=Nitzschia inconspicua TaxID=303405 RepID=A0A9K3L8H3_9STRA|nr:hypothetical protein IV203_002382 [Nitzschia inconspicua]
MNQDTEETLLLLLQEQFMEQDHGGLMLQALSSLDVVTLLRKQVVDDPVGIDGSMLSCSNGMFKSPSSWGRNDDSFSQSDNIPFDIRCDELLVGNKA